MPSLDEAYDRRWEGLQDPNRVGAGLVLAGIGALAVLAAMVLVAARPESTGAKQAAGIATGLGVPAMLLGVVVVLPASRRDRLGVIAGTGLTVLGVLLFWFAYPDRWTRTADPMAFETLAVYAAGCAIGLWFVFSALASTRLRNVPRGTVELEVVREGETRTVEVSRDRYQDIAGDGGSAGEVLSELETTDAQSDRSKEPESQRRTARNRGPRDSDTESGASGSHESRERGDGDTGGDSSEDRESRGRGDGDTMERL
jgi:hypothetical protein